MKMPRPNFEPTSSHQTLSPTAAASALREAVCRACPPWLRQSRDDIAQSAFVRVIARSRRGSTPILTEPYLRRTARNAVIDAMRGRARRGAASDVDTGAWTRPRRLRDPEAALADQALGRRIAHHLGRLPEARRQAVTLFLEGFGVTEIAVRLGWNRKRVDNLVYRGLASLRRSLTQEGVTPATALVA